MQSDLDPLPVARARLAAVLRGAKEVISISDATDTLGIDRTAAAKLLSRWRKQGWLRRIGPGLYVPVPLDLAGSDQVVEDPWVLVPALFGNSYIGGWTAAHHWDLTEQLFNETLVFTTKRISTKSLAAQGVTFRLNRTTEKQMFGLKAIWRGSRRVNLSDPARTVVDMLTLPESGGGIDHVGDRLVAHRTSHNYDGELLIRYAERFGNGVIFKRLGFLAEVQLHDSDLASACRKRLTQGYAQLDPALTSRHLHTAWRLWVPERWHRMTS